MTKAVLTEGKKGFSSVIHPHLRIAAGNPVFKVDVHSNLFERHDEKNKKHSPRGCDGFCISDIPHHRMLAGNIVSPTFIRLALSNFLHKKMVDY
jgi:hypothetical protein